MSSFPFLWVLMPSMLQQHPFSHSRGIPVKKICICFSLKDCVLKKRPNGIFFLMVWIEFLKVFSATGILYSSKWFFHFSQTGNLTWDIRRNSVNDSEDCHFQSADYLLWLSAKRYMSYPNCLFENLSTHQDKAYIPKYSWRWVFHCERV